MSQQHGFVERGQDNRVCAEERECGRRAESHLEGAARCTAEQQEAGRQACAADTAPCPLQKPPLKAPSSSFEGQELSSTGAAGAEASQQPHRFWQAPASLGAGTLTPPAPLKSVAPDARDASPTTTESFPGAAAALTPRKLKLGSFNMEPFLERYKVFCARKGFAFKPSLSVCAANTTVPVQVANLWTVVDEVRRQHYGVHPSAFEYKQWKTVGLELFGSEVNKLMGANAAGHAARAFEVSHLNEFLEMEEPQSKTMHKLPSVDALRKALQEVPAGSQQVSASASWSMACSIGSSGGSNSSASQSWAPENAADSFVKSGLLAVEQHLAKQPEGGMKASTTKATQPPPSAKATSGNPEPAGTSNLKSEALHPEGEHAYHAPSIVNVLLIRGKRSGTQSSTPVPQGFQGANAVGHRLKVWRPIKGAWCTGKVVSYKPGLERGYCIHYDSGDRSYVNLSQEDWRIAADDKMPMPPKVLQRALALAADQGAPSRPSKAALAPPNTSPSGRGSAVLSLGMGRGGLKKLKSGGVGGADPLQKKRGRPCKRGKGRAKPEALKRKFGVGLTDSSSDSGRDEDSMGVSESVSDADAPAPPSSAKSPPFVHPILLGAGGTIYTEHTLKQFKQLGLDQQRATKLAKQLHADSAQYAHKLVTTRHAIKNKNTVGTHGQVLEPGASSNPPDPH
ncbi:hypothetical protein DUNSADRAFT_4903 [Dunaliella salina]|uniref:Uncharacterized protein n=1 Tax=Dunaliella salina TaxID=3046 RepID=A0ABQ7GR33_DUNSA|nr:hypothetical protein DUNSADRAFT_4903 [Dunaliella salina]|eukprot:KAF5837070.1 hypothetical protein DUNSADRAFT_4903 [Dunaliella salina]